MFEGSHATQEGPKILTKIFHGVGFVLVVVAIYAVLRIFILNPFAIPSGSMEETIMPGDMVFSEKITYYTRGPQYGDIVTFEEPNIAGRNLIKRVIATEGQTVDLRDGKVYVDGVALDEPYTNGKPSYPLTPTYGVSISYPYTVPEGEIWVMGDNRTDSSDSRYFGSVPVSSVSGRAFLTYWPLSSFGLLQ